MSADTALFAPLLETPFFRTISERLRAGEAPVAVSGLIDPAKALLLTLLAEDSGGRFLVVVADDRDLERSERDFTAAAAAIGRDPRRVVALPALDADPWAGIPPHPELALRRVVALSKLARGAVDIALTPARALLSLLPSPEELAALSRIVRPGDSLAPERFVPEAIGLGYRRVDTVSAPGEVSRRGGIVDIFPPELDEPVRIELFGDSVESLRSFDTDHQRSTGRAEAVPVGPVVENPPTEAALGRLAAWLEAGSAKAWREDGPVREFRERLEALRTEGGIAGFDGLAGIMAARPVGLTEHARGLWIVADEPERVEEAILRADLEIRRSHQESDDRILPPPATLFARPGEAIRAVGEARMAVRELVGEEPGVEVASRTARSYAGRIAELVSDLTTARERGGRTICMMRAPGSARRLGEILEQYGVPAAISSTPGEIPGDAWTPGGLFVVVNSLRAGFEFPAALLTVLSEKDVFGEEIPAAERRPKGRAAFLSDFRDLRQGDLVVHVDHGIARYKGLGRPKGGSLNRDFMILEYEGGDRLFVPVDRLDLVQKYSGVAGQRPVLDRLGGPGWDRVKTKVRKSMESLAKELLDLYARRRATPGHAFQPDDEWQRELEEAFPYVLTPDQDRAIREVKADMESDLPMDRLLVGDVGFGKTEVAVRASFKAVQGGHQVAVLAPTTVLAAQHLHTFRDRFAPFPINVRMVSRFRSGAEIREDLDAVETGEVDVLIGTHRLLSADVRFRKLGLLIVDEEQRFGVKAKERIKSLSLGIDVLAMTATPIPRTLQMSLAGVRDLSVIETPPPGRTAIQTFLLPFRKGVIAQAIRHELRRNGQVFFVHDRVETLPALARGITEMVPEARLVVAHGQLRERALESAMLRFVEHEADVLVTTTIIENGLDIPRANTIIVNHADRFGLAQLYQLRGRVGRSEQHAYAYFVIPGREALTDTARKRLRALQEFSELGSGFRLAAVDLEIRGAGEFLGARQHGHIASLGFDLYAQLLERTVRELKGEKVEERPPVTLHLGVDIKIPESYMPEVGDRLALYKRLASVREEAEVDAILGETEDRYGRLPPAGANLFDLSRLRLLAERAGVKAVDAVESRLQIRFHERPDVDPRRVIELLGRRRGSLSPSGMMILPAPERASERVGAVREILLAVAG